MQRSGAGVLLIAACLFTACEPVPPPTQAVAPKSDDTVLTPPPKPPKIPCPVRLTNMRMVHNLEMDVYATITNISKSTIIAISFEASHTDNFGDTLTPYKTVLSSEEVLSPGRSEPMHWEILMEEQSGIHNAKPGQSEMYVDRVAFKDGGVFRFSDIDGCDFVR